MLEAQIIVERKRVHPHRIDVVAAGDSAAADSDRAYGGFSSSSAHKHHHVYGVSGSAYPSPHHHYPHPSSYPGYPGIQAYPPYEHLFVGGSGGHYDGHYHQQHLEQIDNVHIDHQDHYGGDQYGSGFWNYGQHGMHTDHESPFNGAPQFHQYPKYHGYDFYEPNGFNRPYINYNKVPFYPPAPPVFNTYSR